MVTLVQSLESMCISYCVTVTKYQDQKQLEGEKGLFQFMVPRNRIYHGEEGLITRKESQAWWQKQEADLSYFNPNVRNHGGQSINLKLAPNSATNWKPSVQIQGPIGVYFSFKLQSDVMVQ